MFDFAALPPEVNSTRMYSGPGAGPLLSAATAWDGLSAELHAAAVSAQSVIAELTGSAWSGPSAASMAAAVAPHIAWLTTTATQAEQTAMQARAAAAAYETAFAMTVPPAVVAANRSLLAALVAGNILGQNTPAILTTEAHYTEMWAQDALAMHGYAGSAAANSSTLTPFTAPTSTANPAGPAAALAQAATTSAGSHAQTLTQLTSALNTLASPAATTTATPTTGLELGGVSVSSLTSLFTNPSLLLQLGMGPGAFLFRTLIGFAFAAPGGAPAAAAAAGGAGSVGAAAVSGLGSASSVLAGVGQAGSLGALSVPPAWAAAAPAAAADLTLSATAAALPDAMRYSNIAMAGLTGLAVAGTARMVRRKQGDSATHRMPTQIMAAGRPAGGTATKLRRFAEIIESGVLTDVMLNQLLDSGALPAAVTE